MSNVDIYKRAKNMWGKELQLVVAMEEMAELSQQLSKWIRERPDYNSIAEELADVIIMLEQIEFLASAEHNGFSEKVAKFIDHKLSRLNAEIDNLEAHGVGHVKANPDSVKRDNISDGGDPHGI